MTIESTRSCRSLNFGGKFLFKIKGNEHAYQIFNSNSVAILNKQANKYDKTSPHCLLWTKDLWIKYFLKYLQ